MLKKKKKQKIKSVSRLKNDAWNVFSRFIRIKYSINGYASCVTCGVTKPWQELQGGHFTQGRHNMVLFDERNVHPQCYQCNCLKHGNLVKYTLYMQEKYGQEVVDELLKLDDENKKFTKDELIELKEKYEKLFNEFESPLDY